MVGTVHKHMDQNIIGGKLRPLPNLLSHHPKYIEPITAWNGHLGFSIGQIQGMGGCQNAQTEKVHRRSSTIVFRESLKYINNILESENDQLEFILTTIITFGNVSFEGRNDLTARPHTQPAPVFKLHSRSPLHLASHRQADV